MPLSASAQSKEYQNLTFCEQNFIFPRNFPGINWMFMFIVQRLIIQASTANYVNLLGKNIHQKNVMKKKYLDAIASVQMALSVMSNVKWCKNLINFIRCDSKGFSNDRWMDFIILIQSWNLIKSLNLIQLLIFLNLGILSNLWLLLNFWILSKLWKLSNLLIILTRSGR